MYTPIVPQHVLERYLSAYPTRRDEIFDTYAKVRAQILNAHTFSPDDKRELLMTAGAPGAGKSTHLRQKVANAAANGTNYVRIDIDDIIEQFPSFNYDSKHLSAYFDGHSGALQSQVLLEMKDQWVGAAKYVADRVLNDCAYLGVPVAFETSAHNHQIGEFFENARTNGYRIELDLCDAPLAIKQEEDLHRFGYHIAPSEIAKKDSDVTQNIERYVQHADVINVLWRGKAGQGLTLAATSTGNADTSVRHNERAAKAFDMAHADSTSIDRIIGTHAFYAAQRKRPVVAAPRASVA